MGVVCTEKIKASAVRVWDLISDIDGAPERMSAVTKVEVVHRPENGSLLGLKWAETRMMFGREATETHCISAVEPGQWYEMRAKSCGTAYTSRISVKDIGDGTSEISINFDGQPLTWWARILGFILTPIISSTVQGCMAQDLADIRTAAES